jgi:hypothetical protein
MKLDYYLIAVIIVFIMIGVLFIHVLKFDKFGNLKTKIFKSPPSLTKLKSSQSQKSQNNTISSKDSLVYYCDKFNDICNRQSEEKIIIKDNNIISTPGFFYATEKWPGCLPRPLFQGSCGSCWGFATVTCLSSRFYIESCGISGCNNYPQINNGSINQIYGNLYTNYRFHKIYLQTIIDYIDTNKDKFISKNEWVSIVTNLQKKLFKKDTIRSEKYKYIQILIYMLDFQSLGSVNLEDKSAVSERSKKTFAIWLKSMGSKNSNG